VPDKPLGFAVIMVAQYEGEMISFGRLYYDNGG